MDREQRYLNTQRLIVFLWCFAIGLMAGAAIKETYMGLTAERRVQIESNKCYAADQRAILHTDGTIECRPRP